VSTLHVDSYTFHTVRLGDVIISGGVPHVITRIEKYEHPSFPGKQWCIAYEDRPHGARAWGITIESDEPLKARRAVAP
jgi:hypothetical protein